MAADELRRRAEEARLKGWPALREVLHDGWLLRFAEGHTRRANSVNPTRPGTQPLRDKIAYCEALYAPRAGSAEIVETVPSDEWLAAHARCTGSSEGSRRVQRKILLALAIPAVFTAVHGEDGRAAARAFGAVLERIVCVNLVVTDPASRRRGLSRRAVSAVLAWARDHAGAEGACLPVVASNTSARALYRELGFTKELYRYHYRRRSSGVAAHHRSALWMR